MTWQKKVDNYHSEQSKMNGAIRHIKSCQTAVAALKKECGHSAQQVIYAGNRVDQIQSNIRIVEQNLGHQEIARLFVKGSLELMDTLAAMVK